MAGTINLAFTQQFDMDGVPLSGGLLYFFTAGTTTPQSAFQDTGLTITHPNPIVLDASGRVPMFYLADGFIKIRLTDKNGVTVIAADQLLVIGPSGGTGTSGSTPGDVTQFLTTGDIKARYSTIAVDGYVRLNGLSIGNIGSSATERADPACLPLFTYLWAFANITLDGFAKGADALTDWGALRRLFLPDLRGRTIAGLDDMGNAAALRLTSTFFGASGTVLGNAGGDEKNTLTSSVLPAHKHPLDSTAGTGSAVVGNESADHAHAIPAMTTGGESATHTHTFNAILGSANIATAGGNTVGSATAAQGTTDANSPGHTHTIPANTYNTGGQILGGSPGHHNHGLSGSTENNTGGGGAHANVQPAMVLTFYMKM